MLYSRAVIQRILLVRCSIRWVACGVCDVQFDRQRALVVGFRDGISRPRRIIKAAHVQRMAAASSTFSFMNRSMGNTLFL